MAVNKKKTARKPRKKASLTRKPLLRKRVIRRPREFIPGNMYMTSEYTPEPIDFEPMPERVYGKDTHYTRGTSKSQYSDNALNIVTVHKPKTEWGKPSKMSGMVSFSCSQQNTEACVRRMESAMKQNTKLKNAIKAFEKLNKKKAHTIEETNQLSELYNYINTHYKHICGECYAARDERFHHKVREAYEKQGDELRSHIFSREEIPQKFQPGEVVRINAYGDLENGERGIIQFINYLNIAYQNPHTYFTMWTKQPHVIKQTFERIGYRKPKNLKLIYSNGLVNKVMLQAPRGYPFMDGVFNVVDSEYYKRMRYNEGIMTDPDTGERIEVIMCSRMCQKCKACYSNKTKFAIIEVIKAEAVKHEEEIYGDIPYYRDDEFNEITMSGRKVKGKAKQQKKPIKRKIKKPNKRISNILRHIPMPLRFRG